jgi:cell division inhibitor SulA/protein ImuA
MSFDELLRHPALWRAREQERAAQPPGLPTGFTALDGCLPGGGWPRQGLIEILTERCGVGELGLMLPVLAGLCAQGDGWLAWVAPPYQPYAPALAAGGIDVQRVLVVHADAHAAWAMEQALRSGACCVVLGWAQPRGPHALRRLQLAAEQSRCLAVLFRRSQESRLPSPALLRIMLAASHAGLEVRILKSRGGRSTGTTLPYDSLQ